MRINFLVNEVAGGWEPTDTRLGGTEESVVRWAECLMDLGQKVNVFRNSRDPKQKLLSAYEAAYWPRGDYQGGGDVCINVKSSEVPPKEPTLYLTNETNASDLDLSAYNGVIWPSEWAKDNIPVNNKTFVLPHGYDDRQIYPDAKIPLQCFYASSPDRGLETLLEAWPEVHKWFPTATLLVTYNGTGPSLPGVMYLGDTDEETMNEIYRTSDIWCHPCSGGELFGITGIKAQAAGCVPVYIPTMALQETIKHGVKCTKENFADQLKLTMRNKQLREDIRTMNAKEQFENWSDSTGRLLEIIHSVV